MKRIAFATGLFLFAAAALSAAQNADAPRYVAVEVNLDWAVRDPGAGAPNQLVGSRSVENGGTHALLRRDGQEIDLHPEGATSSRAIAGDAATQLGSADIAGHSHAMVWRAGAATAVDLHALLAPGYTDSVATGIDDAGNITGVAIANDGVAHDILWRAVVTSSGGSTSGGGGGSGGSGGGSGGVPTTDKISITRALWFPNPMAPPTGELLVQATSSNQNAVLTLSDSNTGEFIALLPNLGGGRYGGSVIFRFNRVSSVTVTSNMGGTASRSVILGTP